MSLLKPFEVILSGVQYLIEGAGLDVPTSVDLDAREEAGCMEPQVILVLDDALVVRADGYELSPEETEVLQQNHSSELLDLACEVFADTEIG